MGLTAEYQLRSPQMPLIDVASAVPDLTVRLEDATQPQSGPQVFFVRITGPSFDGVDIALKQSSSVSEYFLISEVGSIRMYQLILTSARPASIDTQMSRKMFPESVTIMPDGWRIKQQFADRDEFTTYQDFWQTTEFSFHLDRLYDSRTTDTELIGLSDKQREALLTAYKEGYFAIPREDGYAVWKRQRVPCGIVVSVGALRLVATRPHCHLDV